MAAIELIIDAREHDLGGGFKVRRLLPYHKKRMVGPFIFFDHFGPAEYAPGEGMDVRPHPHIGLATVTYLFDGAIEHKDTVGSDLVIRPGAVNWMVAGKGIVHSERTPAKERAEGMKIHGIQTWVALPKTHEICEPSFTHHPSASLPAFDLGGGEAQLLAGSAWGHTSPVKFPWGIWYLGISAPNRAEFSIPTQDAEERAVYVAGGKFSLDGQELSEGQMAILKPDIEAELIASPGSYVMLAGGQTMDGERLIDWNLVSSRKDLIEEARTDWQTSAQKGWTDTVFKLPDGETEYIPLPEHK